jgi:hypothetical protein
MEIPLGQRRVKPVRPVDPIDEFGRPRPRARADDAKPQGYRAPSHRLADMAQADDGERLAGQRLHVLPFPPVAPLLVHELRKAHGKGDNPAHDVIGHDVARDTGTVGHGQLFRVPGVEMIDAHAADAHPPQAGRLQHCLARIGLVLEFDGEQHLGPKTPDGLAESRVGPAAFHRRLRKALGQQIDEKLGLVVVNKDTHCGLLGIDDSITDLD